MDLWVENTVDIEHRIEACGFPLAASSCCPLAPLHLQITTEHTLQGRPLGRSIFPAGPFPTISPTLRLALAGPAVRRGRGGATVNKDCILGQQ